MNNSASINNMAELLQLHAINAPFKTAYIYLEDHEHEKDKITYQQLDANARAIALLLKKHNISSQDRALLVYEPGLEFICAFFGCLYADVIAVPVFPPMNQNLATRIHTIVHDCEPKIMLTTKKIGQKIQQISNIKWLEQFSLFKKYANKLSTNISLVKQSDLLSLPWLVTEINTLITAENYTLPTITKNSIAFLQYSSGSTSQPKGIKISHGNLLSNLAAIRKSFGLDETSICVTWLPPYHDMGLIGTILQPLYSEFISIIISSMSFLRDPTCWLKIISKYNATVSGGPNFAYDYCTTKVPEDVLPQINLSSWTVAFNGAEPIRASTIEKFSEKFLVCGFRKEAFLTCYGLAESTLLVAASHIQQEPKKLLVNLDALALGKVEVLLKPEDHGKVLISSGQSIENQTIAIVNPKTRLLCPPNMLGEIWIMSDCVAQGYWSNKIGDADCFNAEIADQPGYYLQTGDLGFIYDGELYITGRLKDMIKIHGKNFYPHDIEDSISHCHPAIRVNQGAAFSIDADNEEKLIIVQEILPQFENTLLEISLCIKEKIFTDYGIAVDTICLVKPKSIPKTTSGKIQRYLCREKFLNKEFTVLYTYSSAYYSLHDNQLNTTDDNLQQVIMYALLNPELTTPIETKMLGELGFDSIKIIELQTLISQNFGIELSVEYLINNPTIKDIKDKIIKKNNVKDSDLQAKNYKDLLKQDYETYKLSFIPNYNDKIKQEAKCFPFITGATGFVGAYLLHELLKNKDKIFVLVRAKNLQHAQDKITNALTKYSLWENKYLQQIIPICGDIKEPRLGMSEAIYNEISCQVDKIYHFAALLNFVLPYEQLRSDNIIGTKNIIDFAAYNLKKEIHFASTIGYFLSAAIPANTIIDENTFLDFDHTIYGGYCQSKWLAEKLVLDARLKSIPTYVYRLGLVTGDTQYGYSNLDDLTCRILKKCIQLESFPAIEGPLNLIPVDWLAKAISTLSSQELASPVLHLTGSHELTAEQLVTFIDRLGFKLKLLDNHQWTENAVTSSRNDKHDPLYSLLPMFTAQFHHTGKTLWQLFTHTDRPTFKYTETLSQLNFKADALLGFNENTIKQYFNYFQKTGFLNKE